MLHSRLSGLAHPEMPQVRAKIAEVFQDRCQTAFQSFGETASAAMQAWSEAAAPPQNALDLWRDVSSYWIDFNQRSVLFWDTLRQRGNNWLEHEKEGKPPLLHFDWEVVADAREFERPANYALVRIVPPPGTRIDPNKRPFVIIDPRAGHGPGIGGFKQDSEVGVAMEAGHPVYFVIFFPEPMPGQTLADVSRAETKFLQIVRARHPETHKPVVVGNCQGGWAAMLAGALDPDLPGPIVINGAPMSYWAGNDGENPMRYAGGILGGSWPALLASDLGGGLFDGAYLVDNFEYLNPANTFFGKYYTLFSKIDTEPERFLEFERWWGGFFLMARDEIKWIVENLFVGNKLASGQAEWSEGRTYDLRDIKSPIILFASLGDNITPPQQAFNWVADLYPTTEALKANGQVIVGLMHENVGHLGIFVSGRIAKREHAQIVDLIDYIETLPPGLYGMQIEDVRADGHLQYDIILRERRVEDLQALQKYHRKDEVPFEAVTQASQMNSSLYEQLVHPLIAPMVSPAAAQLARRMHPLRVQRWALSDLNPFLAPLAPWAEFAKAGRAPRQETGPSAAWEHWLATMTSASWDLFRDLRDASVEAVFFSTYAPLSIAEAEAAPALLPAKESLRASKSVQEALSHIDEGGRMEAIVRMALLLRKIGPEQRRLSTIKQVRELVGHDVGLLAIPEDEARKVIRTQSHIVDYEPERALTGLTKLLRRADDRKSALAIFDNVATRIEMTPGQRALLEEFRQRLGGEDRTRARAAVPPRPQERENRRRSRSDARARARQ
ncbi:DUF3141 domain-containing protein [Microvirga terricola]|uniref:DUF3141 domain-containing protein n=1 Tax=Microvirga terricola TaxID=2719797 RepID=A0ABX0VCR9_9HYPH|nr:DUF3141 domain-containing protein [Microvirga terricola]NIX77298.1 DUF3141 domain-containing protein [Microvirga terricola]